jgi:hypothetical protein
VRFVLALVIGFGGLVLALPLLVLSVLAAMPWLAVGAPGSPPVHVVVPVPTAGLPGVLPVPLGLGDRIIAEARAWLGTPYQWGGCGHAGIDCSCLVQNVYRAVGLNVPRTSSAQWTATARVSRDQLVPGDLVFFDDTCTGCGPNPTHVGIFVGSGQMIDAPEPGRVVSVDPVFGPHFAGGGRVAP